MLLGSLASRDPDDHQLPAALTYRRLDAFLDPPSLIELGRPDLAERAQSLLAGRAPGSVDDLLSVGELTAARTPPAEILLPTFDVRRPV